MLVPIVIFATIASIMKIGIWGNTYSLLCNSIRYFCNCLGNFQLLAGAKNGIITIILIVISVISIVPPVDAFTVSRNNQTGIIRDTLIKNNMLDNNRIKPGTDISAGDRKKIVEALGYLNRMDYTHMASFLPPGFEYYSDFEKVFGFKMYDWQDETKYVYIRLDDKAMLDIAGYEVLAETTVMLSRNHENYEVIGNINKAGKSFTLKKATTLEDCIISLFEGDDQELLSFSTKEIFEEFNERDSGAKESISIEEATFSKENEHAVITVVIKNMNFEVSPDRAYYAADVFILVKIK